jgi:hypothetical protein
MILFIEPCLPTISRTVPIGRQWLMRSSMTDSVAGPVHFICRRDGERVRVFSRNGRNWTDRVLLIAGGAVISTAVNRVG